MRLTYDEVTTITKTCRESKNKNNCFRCDHRYLCRRGLMKIYNRYHYKDGKPITDENFFEETEDMNLYHKYPHEYHKKVVDI